jgi:flagellum-specific peptidoglycan hydrolase FlgJ
MKNLKVSKKGYKKNSPDNKEEQLLIPSNHITMKGVPHPVMGIDDTGHQMMMMPGEEYTFPGSYVVETPLKKAQAGMQIDYGQQARDWMRNSGYTTLADNAEKKTHSSNPYAQFYLNTSPNLGLLNVGNFMLNSISESLARKEEDDYNRQMILMQSQDTPVRRPEGWEKTGNPFVYQAGGAIPDDVSFMATPLDIPIFEGNNVSTTAPMQQMGAPAEPFNVELSQEMSDYANKASKYLKTKAPHTDITGEMLAQGAQMAYQKYGKVVPIQLALAQLQLEGYLAKGKSNKPQRTKNPFNVGNTDSGATITHGNVQGGINAYYDLIARNYLKAKDPMELLRQFTNSKGQRYATDPQYENKLQKIISQMPQMKQGGQHMMPDGTMMSDEEMEEGGGMGSTELPELHLGGGRHGKLTRPLARKILKAGTVNGKPLTEDQEHYFKHIANGEVSYSKGKATIKKKK